MQDLKTAIEIFYMVRDIPYNIPLKDSDDGLACHGKSILLYDLLKAYGYKVRFKAVEFDWTNILKKHEYKRLVKKNKSVHTYVEIFLNSRWQLLDPSFDPGLKKYFHVNEWDGKTSTVLQIIPKKFLGQKQSNAFLKKIRDKEYDIMSHHANKKLFIKLNARYTKMRKHL